MNNEHNVTLTPTEASTIQLALMYMKFHSTKLLSDEFDAIHKSIITKTTKLVWEDFHGE